MPLPRPFGDPFAKREPIDEKPVTTPKRLPISASAFSFQLGSVPKKSIDKGKGREVEVDVKKEKETRDWTPLRARPIQEHTPTSRKLEPLPSFHITPKAGPSRVRVTDSPFAQGIKRKVEPNEHFQLLGNLDKVDLSETLHVDAIKQRVEEEGIGVSPRGKKIIKYHGKGPPPLSMVLSNALSSQQSSLVLFYASIQNTLYPSRTPKKSKSYASEKPLTVAQHIRSAPLVLRPTELVRGKTGWSVMCWCEKQGGAKGKKQEVKQEQKEKQEDSGNPENVGEQKEPVKIELAPGEAGDDEEVGSPQQDPEQDDTSPSPILVIFQPLPAECAKVGLDPRIFTHKPPSPASVYEIGIWGPWTTSTIGLDEGEGGVSEVIFASRYLVAEL